MIVDDDGTFSSVSDHGGRAAVDHHHDDDDVHDHYFVDDEFLRALESAPTTFLHRLLRAY